MIRAMTLGATALALSACTNAIGFAPPAVEIKYRNQPQTVVTCSGKPDQKFAATVDPDVAGAFTLLDTYIAAYDCAAREAANGRQNFEVPAFLSTTAAATGAALGTGATVGILGQTGNALFNAGKGYYDPKAKAVLYRDALEALHCIRDEASGISATKLQQVAAIENSAKSGKGAFGTLSDSPLGKIEFPVDRQYFNLVSGAAGQVRIILADRLSNVGAELDGAALAARIKEIAEEIRKAEQAKKDEAGQQPATPPAENSTEAGQAKSMRLAYALKQQRTVELDLAVLRPKLDECLLRAQT